MTINPGFAKELPLLDHDHERSLIENWQEHGDRKSLEQLVLAHSRLVHSIVSRVTSDPQERDDLVAEGHLGLIKAANMFDLSRNLRFSTYARWWTRNHVIAARARLRTVVDTPANPVNGGHVVTSIVTNDDTTIDQLEAPIRTPEEDTIQRAARNRTRKQLVAAMSGLSSLERQVVVARFFGRDEPTIETLSQTSGKSLERLRQIERRAISKLKFELLKKGVSSHQFG